MKTFAYAIANYIRRVKRFKFTETAQAAVNFIKNVIYMSKFVINNYAKCL